MLQDYIISTLTNETDTRLKSRYCIISSSKGLKMLRRKMLVLEEFAFDTETNTLRVYSDNEDFKLVGISISWGRSHNYYIPVGHKLDNFNVSIKQVRKYLKDVFENTSKRIIGHNIKYDMHVLKRVGIEIKTLDIFDTMIASWICDENSSNGLKQNTQEIFGLDQTHFAEVIDNVSKEVKKAHGLKANSRATFDLVNILDGAPYAVDDAWFTWSLYLYYLDKLEEEGMTKIYFNTYPRFLHVLYRMEERGMTCDHDKLQQMGIDMQKDLDSLMYDILELAGVEFKPTSNQQLAELLFGYDKSKNPNKNILAVSFHFPVGTVTAKGMPQTNMANLEKILKKTYKDKRKNEGQELVSKLIEFSKLNKLKTAFVDGLIDLAYKDGRIHPSFNPIGATSGRISCSNPNLMQLPNAKDTDKYQIRDCFIGGIDKVTKKRKYIISVDYSNLEVRVMAHFSKDANLIQAFLDGKDLHGNTAKMMFRLDCDANEVKKKYPDLRQQGKVIAFLIQYGGSAMTLYEDLNKNGELDTLCKENKDNKKSDFYGCKDGKAVAQKLIDLYFKGFPGIANFMRHQKKIAHRQGYINTLIGRKRRLPDINSDNYGLSAYNERLSINACIQGSGADIMINAQNRIEGTFRARLSDEYCKEHNLKTKIFGSERLKELRCDMLVQIHDELLFECPEENCEEAIGIIRDYMIHPFGENVHLNLPLEVGSGYGRSYQNGH